MAKLNGLPVTKKIKTCCRSAHRHLRLQEPLLDQLDMYDIRLQVLTMCPVRLRTNPGNDYSAARSLWAGGGA